MPDARLSSPISVIEGIGPKKSQAFARLGVFTLEDLFCFMPRRYEDRRFPKPLTDLEPGQTEAAIAVISELSTGYDRTEAIISDEYGSARVVWFTYKIASMLKIGMRLALYGQIDGRQIIPLFLHPEFEILRSPGQKSELVGKIIPVYPANSDLTQRAIRKFIDYALKNYARKCLREFLPQRILQRFGMMSLYEAIMQIHSPQDEDKFIRARNRLSFEELFLLQMGVMMRRKTFAEKFHAEILKPGKNFASFTQNLPFKPTDSQRIAIHEILEDIAKPFPMNRLLQGDVGSGKTFAAAAAMIAAVDSGKQAAFMAPTEILAQQHYLKLKKSLGNLSVSLLTGSMKPVERKKVLEGISDGSINIVVGTHAIFSDDVKFRNLALVIVDEQHRFGVLQRSKLISKGRAPHVLTMTATPIPRTLILSVYGDLELSVLNELPSGRKKIQTIALIPPEFWKVPEMIRERVKSGGQVYYVCPVIDESERDLHDATSTFERLKKTLPELRIAMLHGRLPVNEKAEIMQSFSDGKIDLLVATVVIEVGVDVPNATMIIIQDADQFGLAQLHQLRGRVGRGKAQSVCVLLENANITLIGRERIASMVNCSDGFELAEQDLRQRGAGEICGTHQHGVTDFRVADFTRDEKILFLARKCAVSLLEEDPELKTEPQLKREIYRRLGKVLELAVTS